MFLKLLGFFEIYSVFYCVAPKVHKQNKTVPYSDKPLGFFGNSCYGIFDVKDYVL